MSDLISRKRAIEEIQSWAVNLKNPKMLDREDTLYILESIPSVDRPNEHPISCSRFSNNWIPCSDRLPEYGVDMFDSGVIATVEGKEGHIVYHHAVVSNAWYENGEWYVDDCKLYTAKVLAWLPLPEPYRVSDDKY